MTCPNIGSLSAMANTSPALNCVKNITYSSYTAPTQALVFEEYVPVGVDPMAPPIVWWCGGAFTACLSGASSLCPSGDTTACVLMAEMTGRPVYVVNVTQGSRCWLEANSAVNATTMTVNCVQPPAAPAGFTIEYQVSGKSEHLICNPCTAGGAVSWTVSGGAGAGGGAAFAHTGNGLQLSAAYILFDAVAPPRALQDAECFCEWFGSHGGTSAYPGNPLNMQFWSFSSGSNMAAMLMPSSTGQFTHHCDSSGTYKIGTSFLTAVPIDLPAIYTNSNDFIGGESTGATGTENYVGCQLSAASLCVTASAYLSPINSVAVGNPYISMMSGAVADDQTVPPTYNEIPWQAGYAAIGVAMPWLPLTGTPDYHQMDCGVSPFFPTKCFQVALRALLNASPSNGPGGGVM